LGRIFAYWAIVYFGHYFDNYRSTANYWATFLHSTSYVLILTNTWLGYILGDFFTDSSGHPGGGWGLLRVFGILTEFFLSGEQRQKCK
jgi:hypothetical protein